jgi:hypothetical protein
MSSWMVLPRVVRLPLSNGDWVDVKAQLNHGEHQAVLERCYVLTPDGDVQRQPFKIVQATVVAYLVDWSATDLPIRGAAPALVEQALNSISQERFTEIRQAIDAHAEAIERERDEKKSIPTGSVAS